MALFKYSKSVADFFDESKPKPTEGFIRFQIFNAAFGEAPVAEIITDQTGCGRWVCEGGQYREVISPCMYSIPRTSTGLRVALQREVWHQLKEKLQFGGELDEKETALFSYLDTKCRRKTPL